MTRLTHGSYGTMYYVNDMKKAVAYYKEFFGLFPQFESEDWTEFNLGDGTALCLHRMGNHNPKIEGGALIVKVIDIKKLVPTLKKRGVEFERDVFEVHPGAYTADFRDPSGNLVSLYEDTNETKG